MKIILFHPQIPQNTGNIARTCLVTNTELILVRPLGFKIDSQALKRAGLDYWDKINISLIDDLAAYLRATSAPFYFFSSHATTLYTEASYDPNTLLIFGSEVAGLPSCFKKFWPEKFLTIPMTKQSRCLNLATSVGIALYGALSQQHFPL